MKDLSTQSFVQTLTALVLICLLQTANAALPSSLNYQGHLTNSAGLPVDGVANMTFAIYDVETGGTALWSEAKSVTVNQGVFSIELGSGAAVFPPGLFETPLWIGVSVGADTEMMPRRPVTSSGFAFKADDANTLEGISAATLDQSAHVVDTANPHNVSAAQVGAADINELTSHITNTTNPHSVTAAQTGAAGNGDFITHTSNSAAHHPRYTNIEAIASMGVKSDSNALNHDKYTNANAVAAILANDGAGSTLDADKVDGLQASEIIDAAQDEVRTPISSLPFSINQPGSYYLTGNLDGSSGGIDITVDNVTLDLMGFTIDGGSYINDYGIDFNGRSSINIRNGFIAKFGRAGIYQNNTTVRFATVIDVQALGNGTLGSGLGYSGIEVLSDNSHVERCVGGDNRGYGIYAGFSSKLINNTAFGNNSGIAGGYGATLSGNTAYSNTGYAGIYGGIGAILTGNTAYNNSGYGIRAEVSATLIGNTAFGNQGFSGISGNFGSILSGNTAYNNAGSGIYASDGTGVRDNTAYQNAGNGIEADLGASLTGNTVYKNSHWGIYTHGSNLIKDNTLYSNNFSGTAGQGGLYVGTESRVIGNMLDENQQNNIYVFSTGNTIENNHFNGSTNGLNFVTNQNFFANNRAHGNTNNYINSSLNTNGGGNVEY